MRRAGQTPHGARPNREEVHGQAFRLRPDACRLGAPQPPGRSLEPRSNAWPRGMTVLPQGRQNSAYRSGCHKLFLSIARGCPVLVSAFFAETGREFDFRGTTFCVSMDAGHEIKIPALSQKTRQERGNIEK